MELTKSGSQLLIPRNDLDFFKKIKNDNIILDLQYGNNVSKDVLRNKEITEQCPDITKTADLQLPNNPNFSIERIIIILK